MNCCGRGHERARPDGKRTAQTTEAQLEQVDESVRSRVICALASM